jgi:hypothetical protein
MPLCRLKPENDQSSLCQASPRHAIQGAGRTSLRSDELRLGRRFRPENDKSWINPSMLLLRFSGPIMLRVYYYSFKDILLEPLQHVES